jgi:hypothetical protein
LSLGVQRLLREQSPEPGRFWVRFAPRRWPAPAAPWIDLAAGTLGGELEPDPGALETLRGLRLDDVLYLPPVPPFLAARRDALAAEHARRGTPVLVQLLPGDAPPAVDEPLTIVRDLLPLALAGPPAAGAESGVAWNLAGVATAAAWPLLPGTAGRVEELAAIAAEVAASGHAALQGVVLDLAPHQRRALGAGLSERRYLALFHGALPDPAVLVRSAWAAGLEPLLPRPLPRPPLRRGNLRLAAGLATLGELCLRLGQPEPRGQSLLRAARFAERLPQDLEALGREGNLGVLPWLAGEPRAEVEALLAGVPSALMGELRGVSALDEVGGPRR